METAKDIVTILGTLSAIVIGFLGLKTWRIQLRSTADSELARKILVALYKIRISVAHIRRPMRQIAVPKESQFDKEAVEDAYAKQYQDEWNKLTEERIELQVACVEAQAIWDREFLRHIIPLNICIGELEMNLQDYLQAKRNHEPIFDYEKTRKIIYGIGGKSDEFAAELDKVISDIDEIVRPKFERQSFWHSFI